LARFQVNLSPADQTTLMRAVRSATDGSAMTIAGVLLSKLGLTQSPDLLNAVYNMLVARRTSTTEQTAIDLQPLMQGAAGSVIPPTALVAQLGEMLRQTLEESIPQRSEGNETQASTAASLPNLSISADPQSQGSATTTDSGAQNSEQLLGQWVLNAQTDGSVAHRTGTIPLLVGNRLMEVEVALFEQRRNADPKADTRHRQLIFRLNTETMGTVEISARLAGDRVRVHVVSEDGRAASSLSSESPALRAALGEAGWKVDEVVYETRSLGDRNAAASAVIDHVINQDSLNRVI
jgi:flagellar hook-length control protein FliK